MECLLLRLLTWSGHRNYCSAEPIYRNGVSSMKSVRILLVFSLAALIAPAAMAQDRMQQAPPGTVNYVEGAVALDGQPLSTSAVGSKVLQSGQVLSTRHGRAEILLTPGVFLRIGHNSAVQMVNPDLIKTQVRLTNGKATVEVDALYKQNHLEIAQDHVVTRLEKPGLYEFDANGGVVRTFKGRARVFGNPTHPTKVKTSHEVTLPAAAASGDTPVAMHKLRAERFNRGRAENSDALLMWSRLRSKYLAQANAQLAYEYAGYPGFVPGWYWNPWGMGYTWIPGYGMYWNPFGMGFYSPIYMSYQYPYGGYGVSSTSTSNGGRVTAGRHFHGAAGYNGGPHGRFQGGPVRAIGSGATFGGGGAGGGASSGVNLGAGRFGGSGGSHASSGGGHGHGN